MINRRSFTDSVAGKQSEMYFRILNFNFFWLDKPVYGICEEKQNPDSSWDLHWKIRWPHNFPANLGEAGMRFISLKLRCFPAMI